MHADNPFSKAKAGDTEALVDWYQTYRNPIAQFAYQAGLPKEKIGNLQFRIIEGINDNLDSLNEHDAENFLFKKTVEIIENEIPVSEPGGAWDLIKFEEDRETHGALLELSLPERLAVILLHFHDKQVGETADILGTSEELVETDLQSGMEKLRNGLVVESQLDVERRLDLLDKSYHRIEFPTAATELEINELQAADSKPEANSAENKPANRKTVALLAGASLFLTAIIGASFLFNDQPSDIQQSAADEENPTTVSKAMVEEWENEYDEIRSSAPDRLGMSAETFDALEYVQKADALRERTFSRQNVSQLQDDPERMQDQVDLLMLSIETPKGMLDSIDDYRLMASETSDFLHIYTEKTDQLMVIANSLLEEYKEELSSAEVNGQLAPHELTYSRGNYPEEIENLTEALSEYTFQYMEHPNENRFRVIRDISGFYEIHPFNSDWFSIQYLDVLQGMPLVDETGVLWPAEQLPYPIITMVTFVSDPMADPVLKGKVESQLVGAFYTLLKGDENTVVFDGDGVVKEEFQMAWETLLLQNTNPLTFIMLPILEEFEESGWTKSDHYERLEFRDFLYAIEMESNGELEEKLPNANLEIESASLDLQNYDYSDIKTFYDEFSSAHNLDLLSGVEPMEIIKLYYYANEIEDIETMWHLTADDELKPSLEVYSSQWRKRPDITETMRNINIFEENTSRLGRKIFLSVPGSMDGSVNNMQYIQNIVLVTEHDQIWLMQHQMDEYYTKDDNFEEYDSNVKALYDLLQNESLEAAVDATPGEIAGTFLLAMEKEDVKTMRLLLNKGEMQVEDDEFKDRWITSSQYPAYSEMEAIFFKADTYNVGIQGVQGYVDIYKDISSVQNSHHLPMEKVGESWMINDMYGY